MKRVLISTVLIFLGIFAIIIFLSYLKKQNANEQVLYVGPVDVECIGVSLQRCLIVREQPEDNYTLFYDQIAGFNYVPGYEYKLLIDVSEKENPPADVSSFIISLVEILDKVEAPYMVINNPTDMSNVSSSEEFEVKGKGRGLFENNVVVEARTLENEIIAQTVTTMIAPDIGQEGTWETTLELAEGYIGEARIIAYSPSPEDGSISVMYTIRVNFEGDSNMEKNDDSAEISTSDIENINWNISKYTNDEGNLVEAIPGGTAQYEGNKVAGTTGCNNYFAPYELDGNNIQVGPAGSTMMACEDALMTQEINYLQSLDSAATYNVEKNNAMLMNENGDVVVEYSR